MQSTKPRKGPDPSRLLNYTTVVPVDKTMAEIKAILRAHNARSITEVYYGAKIAAVEFVFDTGWGPRPYALPAAKPEVLLRLMVERRNKGWVRDDERTRHKTHVPIASILGRDTLPPSTALALRRVVKQLQDDGKLDAKNAYKALDLLIAQFQATAAVPV